MEIEDTWRGIPSFINDMPQHKATEQELSQRLWKIGFSLALSDRHASAYLNIDKEAFEQMAAVTGLHIDTPQLSRPTLKESELCIECPARSIRLWGH